MKIVRQQDISRSMQLTAALMNLELLDLGKAELREWFRRYLVALLRVGGSIESPETTDLCEDRGAHKGHGGEERGRERSGVRGSCICHNLI